MKTNSGKMLNEKKSVSGLLLQKITCSSKEANNPNKRPPMQPFTKKTAGFQTGKQLEFHELILGFKSKGRNSSHKYYTLVLLPLRAEHPVCVY